MEGKGGKGDDGEEKTGGPPIEEEGDLGADGNEDEEGTDGEEGDVGRAGLSVGVWEQSAMAGVGEDVLDVFGLGGGGEVSVDGGGDGEKRSEDDGGAEEEGWAHGGVG